MRVLVVLAALAIVVAPVAALGQANSSIDTLRVLESTQISYDGQIVDYFLMETPETLFRFIEDSAYIKLLGFIGGIDTVTFPEAIVWMKSGNPMIGDAWIGMLPADGILPTYETIVGTTQMTVGAGTFTVFQIEVLDEDSVYLGEKWWSDGTGLIGWSLARCNETDDLELLSYSTQPSSDFWPHEVGDEYVIQFQGGYTTFTSEYATMSVDGSAADWGGFTPAVQDPSGDDPTGYDGCDIRNIHATADDTYLYLMADFWDGPPDTTWGASAVPAYSFILDDDGAGTYWGYGVSYEPFPVSSWYVAGINLDATGAEVACGSVMELRIPLANLGYYSFELPGYYLAIADGGFDVSCWNTVRLPAYCPVSTPGDVTGDGEVKASDVIYLVNYVLKAGPEPLPCPAAGDATGDGAVKSSDIIHLVNFVYKAGPYPADICSLIPGVWSCP